MTENDIKLKEAELNKAKDLARLSRLSNLTQSQMREDGIPDLTRMLTDFGGAWLLAKLQALGIQARDELRNL